MKYKNIKEFLSNSIHNIQCNAEVLKGRRVGRCNEAVTKKWRRRKFVLLSKKIGIKASLILGISKKVAYISLRRNHLCKTDSFYPWIMSDNAMSCPISKTAKLKALDNTSHIPKLLANWIFFVQLVVSFWSDLTQSTIFRLVIDHGWRLFQMTIISLVLPSHRHVYLLQNYT